MGDYEWCGKNSIWHPASIHRNLRIYIPTHRQPGHGHTPMRLDNSPGTTPAIEMLSCVQCTHTSLYSQHRSFAGHEIVLAWVRHSPSSPPPATSTSTSTSHHYSSNPPSTNPSCHACKSAGSILATFLSYVNSPFTSPSTSVVCVYTPAAIPCLSFNCFNSLMLER